jgi:hypothetical protein
LTALLFAVAAEIFFAANVSLMIGGGDFIWLLYGLGHDKWCRYNVTI